MVGREVVLGYWQTLLVWLGCNKREALFPGCSGPGLWSVIVNVGKKPVWKLKPCSRQFPDSQIHASGEGGCLVLCSLSAVFVDFNVQRCFVSWSSALLEVKQLLMKSLIWGRLLRAAVGSAGTSIQLCLLWNTGFIKCSMTSLSCAHFLKSVFTFLSQSLGMTSWPLHSICWIQISWHRTKPRYWKLCCFTEAMGTILLAEQISVALCQIRTESKRGAACFDAKWDKNATNCVLTEHGSVCTHKYLCDEYI